MVKMKKIREPIVEGIFYPSNKKRLRLIIENLISISNIPSGNSFAIISPHAGQRYSGHLSAGAFKSALEKDIKIAVILAPVHRDPANEIYLPESEYFKTPIGMITVNQNIIDELIACSTNLLRNDIPHLEEHCIEVQLPFLQYLFPTATIVPILMGSTTMKNVKSLSNALQLTFADKYDQTLFVVSANMTSYIKGHNADIEAQSIIKLIKNTDWQGIIKATEKGDISSCGAGCIATILSFEQIKYRIEVLDQCTSAETNFDYSELVHYASIAIYNDGEK